MKRQVSVGDILIGGGAKISIQSMTNTDTANVEKTVAQIKELERAGCDIVRMTVNTIQASEAVRQIVDRTTVPLVADVHFDYKLAIKAMENGIAKIRFNPGNIGEEKNVRLISDCAKAHNVPIRVGVNSGSIEKDLQEKYGRTAKALVESALRHVSILEKVGFYNTVISVKASSPQKTVEAYRLLDKSCDYPLHIGVTEAGQDDEGIYKSVAALGSLLMDGIGDTIRVSLTGDPVQEVVVARKLLRAVGVDKNFVDVISCPTCGRCALDLSNIVREIKDKTKDIRIPLKIAVMGCVVNGIGEAGDCDFGIAGGKDKSALFVGGQVVRTIDNVDIVSEILKLCGERTKNG
ncbi:MAG: flavodoxin-dependent (E)-4-hydroxy-3-methylbut-2-enyl-diphosphate synthase [Clostridia bacterium]|nr:flavodoxin-dependent (E)-4-hydroxy-3-methylbut-2-enyl-diphosphate synthase [Clostridia bacterium]